MRYHVNKIVETVPELAEEDTNTSETDDPNHGADKVPIRKRKMFLESFVKLLAIEERLMVE